MLIFCVSDEVDNYIVLLVLVVGHDGDDGVVYEQSKCQDASKAWERRSGNEKMSKILPCLGLGC